MCRGGQSQRGSGESANPKFGGAAATAAKKKKAWACGKMQAKQTRVGIERRVNASLQANYIDRKKVYQKSYFSSLHQQSGKSTTEIISQQHCLWGRTSQDLKSASNERHIENWRYS